jgi:vacuolar-type H+-ATPase subunit H
MVSDVRQAIKDVRDESLFEDLEPAKKLASKVAQEEIAGFKTEIRDKVQSILDTVNTKQETIFSKIDEDIKSTSEVLTKIDFCVSSGLNVSVPETAV